MLQKYGFYIYEILTLFLVVKQLFNLVFKSDVAVEYPSDSTSYTSGDLLETGLGASDATSQLDQWSYRSSSGLGSEAEDDASHEG